jgi:PEP-CTERM motif
MTVRLSRSVFGIGSIAGSLWLASAASAVPLQYGVVVSESNVRVDMGVNAAVDFNPDFTELLPGGNDFPFGGVMNGFSNTFPTPQSKVTADVGLPSSFNGGASGITFSELSIRTANVPGAFSGLGVVSVPLDITGSSFQLLAFGAKVSHFDIVLDDPFSSTLTPTGNPNEWLWAGLANVTLSGEITPLVEVPSVQTLELDPVPFSQAVTIPLAGTFSGNQSGTEITVGIPIDTLENQDLSLPTINQQFKLLQLGLITGFLQLDTLLLTDFSTEIVYRNATTPIPEPSTMPLIGLALAGFAMARRRR